MISPTRRADALGKRFRKGIALGSAKATSGRDTSSGIASETKPWRVAPPKMNDVPKTAALSQNTRSLRNRPLSSLRPRPAFKIDHPPSRMTRSVSLAHVRGDGKRPDLVIRLRRAAESLASGHADTTQTISERTAGPRTRER